jgi:hypothetical protein
MFVPILPRRAGAAGTSAQVKIKPAIVMTVAAAGAAGIISDVLDAGSRGGGWSGVAIGLAIGVAAAALGLVLARAIGRQVKA